MLSKSELVNNNEFRVNFPNVSLLIIKIQNYNSLTSVTLTFVYCYNIIFFYHIKSFFYHPTFNVIAVGVYIPT